MKNNSTIWIVIIGAVLLIAALLFFLMPKTEKTDTEKIKPVNWTQTYEPEDKSPYGSYIFFELVRKYYIDNEKTVVNASTLPDLNKIKSKKPYLLMAVNRRFELGDEDSRVILEYVDNGNYAFLAAEQFSYYFAQLYEFYFEKKESNQNQNTLHFVSDSIKKELTYPQYFYLKGKKEYYNWQEFHFAVEDEEEDEYSYEYDEEADATILEEAVIEDESYDETYTEDEVTDEYIEEEDDEYSENVDEEFEEVDLNDIYSEEEEEDYTDYIPVLDYDLIGDYKIYEVNKDEDAVYISIEYGKGKIFFHIIPMSFTNIALLNEQNVDHLEKVLKVLPEADLIWQDEEMDLTEGNSDDEDSGSKDNRSPLQFILSVPSLRWAYYLTLASLLVYILFRIKRRARPIPAMAKNENKTMDFADTVSEMYFQKAQHRSIILHKEKLFYHFVREKYFISSPKKDENFIRTLSNKSSIPEDKIKEIVKTFETNTKGMVTEKDLIEVHQQTEYFYKNCK